MNASIKARLAALEQLAGSYTGGHVYICDDGSEFQSGNYDLAYYQLEDEILEAGHLEFSEPKGDEVP